MVFPNSEGFFTIPMVASVFTIVQMRKDAWPDLWIVLIAPSGARVEVGFSKNSPTTLFGSPLPDSKLVWASRSDEGSLDIVLVLVNNKYKRWRRTGHR